ncbi:hypothetical protein [Thalassomonas viridans]|uniref:hypothetical protein n=1 Tax=Thalassomonas viridans TaxID=137584 RepID=UPI0026B55E14
MFRLPLTLLSALLSVLLVSLPVSSWQGDPTRPLVPGQAATTVQSKGELVLQSVIRKQQAYKAVINGRLVSRGDNINEYRVVEIKASSVLLESAKAQLELSLFSGAVFAGEVKQQE